MSFEALRKLYPHNRCVVRPESHTISHRVLELLLLILSQPPPSRWKFGIDTHIIGRFLKVQYIIRRPHILGNFVFLRDQNILALQSRDAEEPLVVFFNTLPC